MTEMWVPEKLLWMSKSLPDISGDIEHKVTFKLEVDFSVQFSFRYTLSIVMHSKLTDTI
jgi:hypothetical protein